MALWGTRLWGAPRKWSSALNLSCQIAGTLRDIKGMVVEDVVTAEPNSASFNTMQTYANRPIEGQEIILHDGNERLFAGRIISIETNRLDGTDWDHFVECEDYTLELQKYRVVEHYVSQTLYYIVKDIIDNYTDAGVTYNNVVDLGTTIDDIKFDYLDPQECFEKLAELTGWDWYIDYIEDIHFFPKETNNAPFALEDNATNFDALTITVDQTQLRNRVYVRGGFELSTEYPQTPIITAAGAETEFPIRWRPFEFRVEVNSVAKTVGIANVDAAGTHDFLVNYDEKVLIVDTIGLNPADSIEQYFKYEIPITAVRESISSQNALKAIEGGNGVREFKITDEALGTRQACRDRANAELLRYANSLVHGKFLTTESGVKSGQRLHINLTDRSIDEHYMIRKVIIEALGGNKLIYTVEFSTFLLGFTWMIIKILDATRKTAEREDVVLDRISVLSETINLSVVTTTTFITPPYQYGAGGSPQGIYHRAQYG